MDIQVKTAFYWLLLGICFLTHTVLHIYGLFYGADIRLPEATMKRTKRLIPYIF
jgi:hypothetical protein